MTASDSLDADTVDTIFARFAVVYGARFMNQWPAASLPEVKAGWAHELREFAGNSGAIDYALEHLPSDHAPMVLAFRDIARTHVAATNATKRQQDPPVTEADKQRALDILRSFRPPA